MKELELYDIYGTWHRPFWQTKLFLVLLSLVCSLALLALAYYLYKKYKRSYATPLPQQLLEKLAALHNAVIMSKEDAKQAYSTITDSLKEYFEYYYRKPYKTFTDGQMQESLEQMPQFPFEYNGALKKLIEDSVSVKFARESALKEQILNHAQLAINIINHLEKAQKSS